MFSFGMIIVIARVEEVASGSESRQ